MSAAQIFGPCTIYRRSEFMGNIVRIEARSAEVECVQYAQYADAIEVRFVRKGARKLCGWVETDSPFLLILDGHGHPDPAGIHEGGSVAKLFGGVTMTGSKYSSHDAGWARDFEALIAPHIEAGAVVLADFRGAKVSTRLAGPRP